MAIISGASGNAISDNVNGSQTTLAIAVFNSGGTQVDPTQIRALTAADVVSAAQSGSWSVTANAGTNLNTSLLALDSTVAKDASLTTINNSINTLLKPANTLAAVTTLGTITNALPTGTNSIGQVTANAGTNLNTSALALDATLTGGTQRTKITDGTNNSAVKAASTAALATDPALVVAISPNNTVGVTQSGTWNIGTVSTITNPVTVAQATAANLNATVVGTGTFAVQAAQSGTWNINNISGTISLPTGASTSALQTTGNTSLSSIDGKLPATLGQKTSANSLAVVLASDQSGINTFLDTSGSGTITALNGAVTINCAGMSIVTFSVTGTWVATLTIQGDSGAAQWPAIVGKLPFTSGAQVSTIGSNVTVMVPVGGWKQIRIIATAFTSGTATVTWNAGAGNNVHEVMNGTAAALNAQVVGNVASASTDSGNPLKIGTIANTTLPTVTAGQRVDAQSDLNGRIYTNSVPLDGSKLSYSAAIVGLASAVLATDVFTITGSASKTIRITKLEITLTTTAGTGVNLNISVIKRSTANTGGTSTILTDVPHDSTDAAGTATVRAYTVNPTVLGTTVGAIRGVKYAVGANNTIDLITWDFGNRPAKAIVLRGTTETLAINFNATTVVGGSAAIHVEWTEE